MNYVGGLETISFSFGTWGSLTGCLDSKGFSWHDSISRQKTVYRKMKSLSLEEIIAAERVTQSEPDNVR